MHIIRLPGVASVERSTGAPLGRAIQRARMAMLAVLALSGTRTARRDRLMALLWSEHNTDRARHLLREGLYRLRETLGDDVLLTSGDEIRLNGVTRCDVWEFEEAVARRNWVEADRLYTGPLLDGFFLDDAPEFERWISEERERLAKLHAQAIESHAIECAARADWTAAVRLWQRRRRTRSAVIAAPFDPQSGEAGAPKVLFSKVDAGRLGQSRTRGYDVTPGGAEFLLITPVERARQPATGVVLNWLEELKRKVP